MQKRLLMSGIAIAAIAVGTGPANAEGYLGYRVGAAVNQTSIEKSGFGAQATGWDLFIGKDIMEGIGFEVGGGRSGKSKFDQSEIYNAAWHASVLAEFPFGDSPVFGFVRVGFVNWYATTRTHAGGIVIREHDAGFDPYYGAGVMLATDKLHWRLEYDRSEVNQQTSEVVSLAAVARF